jgi:hypothetical protein
MVKQMNESHKHKDDRTMDNKTWEERVRALEEEGLTRSDAQAVVDAEDQRKTDDTKKAGSKNRPDKLDVYVYALHGDTCGIAPHCESLGCASGFKSSDYVLSARFAYLQEAIDYCQQITGRGVHVRMVSKIVSSAPFIRKYAPAAKVCAA